MELPRPRPARVALEGHYCRLEPLATTHAAGLYDSCRAPELYRWLFENPPRDADDLLAWIGAVSPVADPLYFAVIDRASGRIGGRQALMRVTPEHGVIEVGGICWGAGAARTRVSTEALYLFARHAFEDLGYRRFEWKCNDRNEPSKAAARRFGFNYEGTFRQHMWVKGANRDTAWFSMIDTEWPRLAAAYQRWLDPANFDVKGLQLAALAVRD